MNFSLTASKAHLGAPSRAMRVLKFTARCESEPESLYRREWRNQLHSKKTRLRRRRVPVLNIGTDKWSRQKTKNAVVMCIL
jgi:hypothetical protein